MRGRGRRLRTPVVATILGVLGLPSCAADDQPAVEFGDRSASVERRFAGAGWDTLLQVGGRDPNDTTLLTPGGVRLWGDRLALLDGQNQNLRVLSKAGELLWTVGTRGGGPSEFGQVSSMAMGPGGSTWLLDSKNVKIMEFDTTGVFVRAIPLQHMPVPLGQFIVTADRILFPTQSPEHGVIEADLDSARILRSWPLPWPEPLDWRLNLTMVYAASASGDVWVLAFAYGPGFMVFRGDSVAVHRYVEPVPYALKSGPHVRAMGADSARFAARGGSIVDDEIFFLFGGRPRRQVHPLGEPTVLIDVYGLDGGYRRSYRLPGDTKAMVTEDGQTFYVLTETEDGLPTLLGLRLREE